MREIGYEDGAEALKSMNYGQMFDLYMQVR
jgi:hypothetical protein